MATCRDIFIIITAATLLFTVVATIFVAMIGVGVAEDAELRTHAWPDLTELSSVPLADDFTSSYTGVVVGDLILLDGHDADTETEDQVMIFDRSALRGGVVPSPAPPGMWVGRLGADLLVTIDSKGDPAPGRVLRVHP